MATVHRLLQQAAIVFIRFYQLVISPYLGPSCRFEPSCSNYALDAIQEQGVFKGCYFTIKRLLCCHPFHTGGYDPVPQRNKQL